MIKRFTLLLAVPLALSGCATALTGQDTRGAIREEVAQAALAKPAAPPTLSDEEARAALMP
ncbi:MAG: hypothetical protein ACYCWA_09300, partial [Thiobacillus sp.]